MCLKKLSISISFISIPIPVCLFLKTKVGPHKWPNPETKTLLRLPLSFFSLKTNIICYFYLHVGRRGTGDVKNTIISQTRLLTYDPGACQIGCLRVLTGTQVGTHRWVF